MEESEHVEGEIHAHKVDHRLFRYGVSLPYRCDMVIRATYLNETDLVRVLPEALAAEVEAVLADETSLVSTETAIGTQFGMSKTALV